jgi:hypothetical protein
MRSLLKPLRLKPISSCADVAAKAATHKEGS